MLIKSLLFERIMRKILITGINGRIGRYLNHRLKDDYEIIGIDNEDPEEVETSFDYYKIDVSSDESVKEGFDAIFQKHGCEFEAVIHLVAFYSFKGESYAPYKEITVEGTKRVVNALSSARVGLFIYTSTLLVYKPCKRTQTINEDSPLDPKWEYPKSKVETETFLKTKKDLFPIAILRIAGCYNEECQSIPISNQIKRIYEKSPKSHFYPGDLKKGAAYLHFKDLADAVAKVITHKEQLSSYEIFIMGEEITVSYQELQHTIGKLLWGKPWKTFWIPKWFAKLGAWIQVHVPFLPKPFIRPWMVDFTDDHYQLDIAKSKKLLDWQPQHSLRNALPKMIDHLKKDPLGWYKKNKLDPPDFLKKTD